jgi:DNA mismatch repair protein MLH1
LFDPAGAGQLGAGCVEQALAAFRVNLTGFRAAYSDGKLVSSVPGGSADPIPCAGVPGTQITVEDVFYNMPTRLKAFRNTSEEYNRIVDVVTRYAVHCGDRGIALTCRKQGSASADVHAAPSTDRKSVIRQLFGGALAKELLSVTGGPGLVAPSLPEAKPQEAAIAAPASASTAADDDMLYEFSGLVSNANYSLKRRMFILFINGR